MAITQPAKVPKARITSVDITSFNGGLDQRGDANITPNSFSVGRNVMLTKQGLATYRYGLRRWLPDAVGPVGEVFPALYGGTLYYIIADDGKIKYMERGELAWTDAGGDNVVTTTNVVMGEPAPVSDMTRNTFIRVLDKVLILNGVDNLGYLDLSDMNVYHYDEVTDPANAPTAARTVLTAGTQNVYYAVSFNSTVGETAISPILTFDVNKIRDQWAADGTEFLTITRNNTAPAGAVSWNLYFGAAASGGSIAATDLLPLATGLDLTATTFIDNGSLAVNLSAGTAPEDNSTLGPKAKYGLEVNGRPFLFGITDDEYAIRIGGNGDKALDFSPTNGGFRLVLNQGTNFYPQSVVGFRNGQGIPSITVLFSNTQGLSKQSIIEQQTVDYGDITFVVWGSTEQNYGASGVSSSYGVTNYLGGLYFPSVDGIVRFNTDAGLQNVLSNTRISDPIIDEVSSIKNSQLANIVSTAWNSRVFWSVASLGFSYNNRILVYDLTNKDLAAWYIFEVDSQWIGTIAPDDEPGFVYVCQGNSFYRLAETHVAHDESSSGISQPFPMELTTGLIGSNNAHNGYYAVVQTVFYLRQFLGEAQLAIEYRDRSGNTRRKVRTVTNGEYTASSQGGWSSPFYQYNQHLAPFMLAWKDVSEVADAQTQAKTDLRVRIPINAVTNEMQASVILNPTNSAVIVRSISFEGQNLGIAPDIK